MFVFTFTELLNDIKSTTKQIHKSLLTREKMATACKTVTKDDESAHEIDVRRWYSPTSISGQRMNDQASVSLHVEVHFQQEVFLPPSFL